jgi:hypothetical protein
VSESQPSNAPAAWRTVILTAFALLLQALCFVWGSKRGFDAFSAQAFGSLTMAGTLATAAAAAKSLGEHLGNGSGWAGMKAALLTDTKPGEPAP